MIEKYFFAVLILDASIKNDYSINIIYDNIKKSKMSIQGNYRETAHSKIDSIDGEPQATT